MLNNIIATTPQLIAGFTGIFVFFLVILFAVIRDELQNRNARIKRPDNEWLFTNWNVKLYDAFVRVPPEKMLMKLGVEVEAYQKNCDILYIRDYNLKKLAADKVIGFAIIILGVFLMALFRTSGIVLSIVIILAGFYMYQGNVPKIKKLAKEKRRKIEIELPRFLDLLQTALYIEIPVSDAILMTAKQLDNTIIAKELTTSIAESQMGSISWQKALQNLALLYDVDILSDFVQYLINGYEKGLNIYDVVSRQAAETRKASLLTAEENANRLNTSIIVPISLFKLLPLIIIVGYPIAYQFISGKTIF